MYIWPLWRDARLRAASHSRRIPTRAAHERRTRRAVHAARCARAASSCLFRLQRALGGRSALADRVDSLASCGIYLTYFSKIQPIAGTALLPGIHSSHRRAPDCHVERMKNCLVGVEACCALHDLQHRAVRRHALGPGAQRAPRRARCQVRARSLHPVLLPAKHIAFCQEVFFC